MSHFESLYPGRFLKGITLLQPLTITIKAIDGAVQLESDDGKKESKVVLHYHDGTKEGQIVWNRTNSVLTASALHEPDYTKWIGRQITIHFDPTVAFGAEKKGGIRVLGSPDLKDEIEVAIKMPRRKHPIRYRLSPTAKPSLTAAQIRAENVRLYRKLAEHNPQQATDLAAAHKDNPQQLQEALTEAIRATEGGNPSM